MRIRFQLFTEMWTWIPLFTLMRIPDQSYGNLQPVVQRPSRTIFSLQASIVNVHGPPLLYVEPLKFQSFELKAEPNPDIASNNNKDPDPQPCGNDADWQHWFGLLYSVHILSGNSELRVVHSNTVLTAFRFRNISARCSRRWYPADLLNSFFEVSTFKN
jgi:hypothetical protein